MKKKSILKTFLSLVLALAVLAPALVSTVNAEVTTEGSADVAIGVKVINRIKRDKVFKYIPYFSDDMLSAGGKLDCCDYQRNAYEGNANPIWYVERIYALTFYGEETYKGTGIFDKIDVDGRNCAPDGRENNGTTQYFTQVSGVCPYCGTYLKFSNGDLSQLENEYSVGSTLGRITNKTNITDPVTIGDHTYTSNAKVVYEMETMDAPEAHSYENVDEYALPEDFFIARTYDKSEINIRITIVEGTNFDVLCDVTQDLYEEADKSALEEVYRNRESDAYQPDGWTTDAEYLLKQTVNYTTSSDLYYAPIVEGFTPAPPSSTTDNYQGALDLFDKPSCYLHATVGDTTYYTSNEKLFSQLDCVTGGTRIPLTADNATWTVIEEYYAAEEGYTDAENGVYTIPGVGIVVAVITDSDGESTKVTLRLVVAESSEPEDYEINWQEFNGYKTTKILRTADTGECDLSYLVSYYEKELLLLTSGGDRLLTKDEVNALEFTAVAEYTKLADGTYDFVDSAVASSSININIEGGTVKVSGTKSVIAKVTLSSADGTAEFVVVIPGDVNLDKTCNSDDATVVSEYDVGSAELDQYIYQPLMADMNNETINTADIIVDSNDANVLAEMDVGNIINN